MTVLDGRRYDVVLSISRVWRRGMDQGHRFPRRHLSSAPVRPAWPEMKRTKMETSPNITGTAIPTSSQDAEKTFNLLGGLT